jgi:hypothetical protein
VSNLLDCQATAGEGGPAGRCNSIFPSIHKPQDFPELQISGIMVHVRKPSPPHPAQRCDRRHYGNELRKAQREYERLTREAEAAHAAADRALAEAHRLDCELWSARLFLGGPDQPSPRIADALHGGYPLLEVQCRHWNHAQIVDLAEVIWPRERPVHTIRKALYCAKCEKGHGKKRRPDLIGLRLRKEPNPTSPAAAMR